MDGIIALVKPPVAELHVVIDVDNRAVAVVSLLEVKRRRAIELCDGVEGVRGDIMRRTLFW